MLILLTFEQCDGPEMLKVISYRNPNKKECVPINNRVIYQALKKTFDFNILLTSKCILNIIPNLCMFAPLRLHNKGRAPNQHWTHFPRTQTNLYVYTLHCRLISLIQKIWYLCPPDVKWTHWKVAKQLIKF